VLSSIYRRDSQASNAFAAVLRAMHTDPLEREGLLSAEPPMHSPPSTRHMRSAEFSRT
jgi:hypothetical protein